MENKEFATAKKITQELIGGWFLWGIVFGIIYSVVSNLIIAFVKSQILQAIVVIVLQGIFVITVWKLSTSMTFKKRTMSRDGVSVVMRNLIIFTVIICVVNGIYNFVKVNNTIQEVLNSNVQLNWTEKRMNYLYSEEEMADYYKQKEEIIQKTKKQSYINLTLLELGLTAVYLAVLPLEKRELLKYVS